jgi:uncharacterized membrane protein YbaN (DUF454 family)
MKIKLTIFIIISIFFLAGCQRKLTKMLYNSEVLDVFLAQYADSIGQISKTKIIPKFLSDPQFDWDYSVFSISIHKPLPLRALILKKVKSCSSLRIIMDLRIPEHSIKPKLVLNFRVEDMDKSFYELCENRYRDLKCKI